MGHCFSENWVNPSRNSTRLPEIDSWLARIADGASRPEMVLGFSQSTDFINATRADIYTWVSSIGTDDEFIGGTGDDILEGGPGNNLYGESLFAVSAGAAASVGATG